MQEASWRHRVQAVRCTRPTCDRDVVALREAAAEMDAGADRDDVTLALAPADRAGVRVPLEEAEVPPEVEEGEGDAEVHTPYNG